MRIVLALQLVLLCHPLCSPARVSRIGMDDERTAIGRAPTSMTVQVNGTNATRSGELYYRTLTASNSSAPVWQQVVTRDSDNDPSVTSYFWYDPATLNPQYDEDGNLETDGRWLYTWDAENRLVQMETTTIATTVAPPTPSSSLNTTGRDGGWRERFIVEIQPPTKAPAAGFTTAGTQSWNVRRHQNQLPAYHA